MSTGIVKRGRLRNVRESSVKCDTVCVRSGRTQFIHNVLFLSEFVTWMGCEKISESDDASAPRYVRHTAW